VVIASANAEADHAFFRDVLNLPAVDAGGGYIIFGLPASEASSVRARSTMLHSTARL